MGLLTAHRQHLTEPGVNGTAQLLAAAANEPADAEAVRCLDGLDLILEVRRNEDLAGCLGGQSCEDQADALEFGEITGDQNALLLTGVPPDRRRD